VSSPRAGGGKESGIIEKEEGLEIVVEAGRGGRIDSN
jgi:hypothetical protein